MLRRAVAILALASLLLGLSMHAGATTPEGPRLAISISTDGPGAEDEGSEVVTTDSAGEDPQSLVGGQGALIGEALSWSADGSRLAYAVSGVDSTAAGRFGTGWQVVGVTKLDESATRVFPRAFLNGGEPVMSPDGRSVAFQRIKLVKVLPDGEGNLFASSIWTLDVESGAVRRLTRWRTTAFLDPRSYSPDGATLAAESFGSRIVEGVVAIDLRTRRISLLARNASQPTYSSDGTKLAFLRDKTRYFDLPRPNRPVTELWVARADGKGARRVLRKRGFISWPSWDPSGSRITFTRNPPAEATGALEPEPGNKVMAINADGTCLTRVFTDPDITLYASAWQPGPGREAGPISC